MRDGGSSSGGRRAALPPLPLHAEVVRGRLLDALGSRFDVPITVVVAAAGFGKTTALAQALRSNAASPRGIDAWVACQPGDEDAPRLSAAITTALGAGVGRGGSVDRVLDAINDFAPVDVCIVIDDLHELPPMSAGEDLVRKLAANLPGHAHLVLASRRPIPIPMARRRAAGEVIEVGIDQLAFTDGEVQALAWQLNSDPKGCSGLAGWPSLVRLVLAAPPGALRQFLWEEVVAILTDPLRRGLLALATLGSGSVAELNAVAGADFDLDLLLATVPLLHSDASGTAGAHDLWADAVDRVFPADEVADARRRALDVLAKRGQTVRLGSAAMRWNDAAMFRTACRTLVLESLGALPMDTASRWLAGAPPDSVGSPELQLLELALRHARHGADEDVDAELDQLDHWYSEIDDPDARGIVLAFASVVAHARGDHLRLIELTGRIRSLPETDQRPLLGLLVYAVDAALCSLVGDVTGALRIIDRMSFVDVPPLVRELVTRLQVIMLVLDGRADEAVAVGAPLADSPHAYVRSMPIMMRWFAGDPTDRLGADRDVGLDENVNRRDRFMRAAHDVAVAASLGDRSLARVMRRELDVTRLPDLDARDSAIVSVAAAHESILEHQQASAAMTIAAHVRAHGRDPLGLAHLRRWLAIGYVCNDELRRLWDGQRLGPVHRRTRDQCRALIVLRTGGPVDAAAIDAVGDVRQLITSLPLPWSVELGVRLVDRHRAGGLVLVQALAQLLPGAVRSEIEWLSANGDSVCKAVADDLIDALPDPTRQPLTIDVLGPLRVHVGDVDVLGPEMRRARVRSLLTLLVLRGPMRREAIADLLWPDLSPSAAAQNLRVTLNRLRGLLDSGVASRSVKVLRVEGDVIGLVEPPAVVTDHGMVQLELVAAAQARATGATSDEIVALRHAIGLWRSDPMPDIADLDEVRAAVEFVRQSLVAAALRLGELELVAGRIDHALRCAERARDASPYSERAHRLAIACHLQERDIDRLAPAVHAARRALNDMGVVPEPETEMLLRRASARLGAPGGPTMSQ